MVTTAAGWRLLAEQIGQRIGADMVSTHKDIAVFRFDYPGNYHVTVGATRFEIQEDRNIAETVLRKRDDLARRDCR